MASHLVLVYMISKWFAAGTGPGELSPESGGSYGPYKLLIIDALDPRCIWILAEKTASNHSALGWLPRTFDPGCIGQALVAKVVVFFFSGTHNPEKLYSRDQLLVTPLYY